MCDRWGGEYYISKPRWSSGKIYAPGSPSTGQKESILFLDYFLFWGMQRSNELKKTGESTDQKESILFLDYFFILGDAAKQ